jgi:chromosome segregation protein
MYLKSLDVVGFKSFADRTKLEFHRGVTAIVGPNGCGKSNVLDSIRWVLGEQSAKALRGGEMKDVIFSGTDQRPPLGMAEVSLTFGECEEQLGTEYNEVTITRRVFRDGASEYELNKTPCRLRDIQTLFMDTGVGRSAYSIMEQGKIDLILSSRPEDRRAIFEEAAGITKFKSQKKEALRKLEHTEANLVRLADIIREVKRQIGSLQRQAGKARRYQASFAELAELEHKLGRHQFDVYSGTIAALQAEVEGSRDRQTRLEEEIAAQETQIGVARGELAVLEAELVRLRDEQARQRNLLERAQQRASTNHARVDEFLGLRDQAGREIAATEEKIRVGEDQLRHLNEQVAEFQRHRTGTQEKFDDENEALASLTAKISVVESECAEIEERRLAGERKQQKLAQELSGLELQQRNFQLRLETLKGEQTALRQRGEELNLVFTHFGSKVAGAEGQLAGNRTALEQARAAQLEAEAALRSAEKARAGLGQKRHGLEARREALAQLQAQHANAPRAAQRLLADEAAREITTLAGRITVKAGNESALALLLGDAVHALLLPDDGAARAWRAKVAEREICVFAPLHSARPAPLASSAPTHAANFVTAQPDAAGLLAALLEDAHVVDTLEEAQRLKAAQPQSVVATRHGELITRPGLVLVGQEAGATSLAVFTRQAELRQLESDLSSLAGHETEAEGVLESVRTTVTERSSILENGRGAVQQAEITLATVRQEERAAQFTAAEAARQAEESAREIHRLSAQENADHERHEELRAAMVQAEAALREAEEELDVQRSQLGELSTREETQNHALTERRIELATQVQQCESLEHQREPVAARVQELRELAGQRRRESVEHEQRVTQARTEISAAEAEQATAREAQNVLVDQVAAAQGVRDAGRERIAGQETALRALRRDHTQIHDTRSESEVKLAEQRLFLRNLREKFQRDYQKELEDLAVLEETGDAPSDWSAVEADAGARRAALDALGPVNLEAITEYDELEERHKFLTGQETDLVNAKEQILKAIQEINRTTRKLFAETFEQVKVNFQEMFTELFGGGKASLALMDESDPLECGIEINARPPGKQPQQISLLSGGERTMTAVALLFAIYMVKPSPFCVLDEMDAPLDESNINRFIKILQRFVSMSQFVVITHNKRTISMSDVLYGVTMEERGVSRFVSMRLAQGEHRPRGRHEEAPSIAEAITA